MNPNTKEAYKLFHDGILALAEIERNGMRVDMQYLLNQKKELTEKIEQLEQQIHESEFFNTWKRKTGKQINIYSSVQLANYLYSIKGIAPKKKTAKGTGSTDEEALRLLNIPELELLLEIKKLKKIRDTYLEQFEREQVNGVIRTNYNLHNVVSYRSSSANPNQQNIPKRDKEAMKITRSAIFPRKGHQLLELDYSQLEVRISACYNKDETLIYDIMHGDMHKDVAIELFFIDDYKKETHSVLRNAAKNGFIFPQFYGDYYENCAENLAQNWCKLPKGRFKAGQGIQLTPDTTIADHLIAHGITTYKRFTQHVKNVEDKFWFERYKTYTKWKKMIWEKYQHTGYITGKTGFTYKGLMKRNDVLNYPVQGAAFHCLLWSLIEGNKALKNEKMKTRIVGQIHDAIIFDVFPPELPKVLKIMKCIMCNDVRQHWNWITVPLEIEAEICPVDGSWAEKQEINIDEIIKNSTHERFSKSA